MVRSGFKKLLSGPGRPAGEYFLSSKFRLLIPAVLVLLLVSIFIPSYRIAFVENDGSIFALERKSDFEDYFIAAQTLSRGGDPYKVDDIKDIQKQFEWKDIVNLNKIKEFLKRVKGVGTYLYPPLTAFLLLPVSDLTYSNATIIFQTASILAFLAFLFVLYFYTDRRETTVHFFIPALLSTILLYSFLNGNFLHGNILSFLLLLVAGGIYLSFRSNKFANVAGGFLIGIAVVIKITPVFFGLVLLGKKRFSAIAGMGIGVIAGALIPALYTGYEENLVLLSNWYELILGNYGKQGIIRPWANNQSFSAMIGKLFVPGSDSGQVSYGLPLFKDTLNIPILKELFFVKLARYSNIVLLVSGITMSLVLMIRNFNRKNYFDLQAVQLTYFATLLSLLTAGVSWYHAFGALFFPVFLRLSRHFQGEHLSRGEKIGYYLISVFGLFHMLMGSALKEALALYSVFTFFCVGILIHTFYLLAREKNGI